MAQVFPENLGSLLSPGKLHQRVRITVAHEERGVLVGFGSLFRQILDLITHHQVATQAEDTTQLVGCGNASEDRHRASLREATEDDAVGRDSGGNLVRDEFGEGRAAAEDANFVVRLF